MARNTTITDEAARKRQEIGLSARRETARSAVMRPPDTGEVLTSDESDTGSAVGGWWLVLFVSMLALATFLLIAARFLQSPTDLPTVDAQVADITKGKVSLQGVEGVLEKIRKPPSLTLWTEKSAPRLFDDFNSAQSLLSEGGDANRLQRIDPTLGIYLMRAESGTAAWSLLGDQTLRHYRLETSVRIAFAHPQTSAGLVTRFVDDNHFYLFAVDGTGRFEVLRANGVGNWLQLIPWLESKAVNAAGVGNVLEVEDHGDRLRFSVNGTPLFEHQLAPDEVAASGDAGVWSAAIAEELGEAEFDRIRLEPLENP